MHEIIRITAGVILLATSLLASGIVFQHRRLVTYFSLAAVLWQLQWTLLSYASRTFFHFFRSQQIFFAGSLLILIFLAYQYKEWRKPHDESKREVFWANIIPLIVAAIVISAVLRISSFNGLSTDGSWRFHGFFNGDTFILSSLVERSLNQGILARENFAAANSSLPYPSAVHASIADFLRMVGLTEQWQRYLTWFTVAQVLAIVGMFFLLFDVVWSKLKRTPKLHVITGLIVLLIMAYAWDDYVYPQTHLFVISFELLLAAMLVKYNSILSVKKCLFWYPIAAVAAFTLLVSNSILGTVGMVLVSGFSLLKVLDKNVRMKYRFIHVILLLVWFFIFKNFSVGNPNMGALSFPYDYVAQLSQRVGIMSLLLLAGYFYRKEQNLLVSLVCLTSGLSFVALFFSRSPLLLDNSGRFIYEGLRFGFPLMIPLIVAVMSKVKSSLTPGLDLTKVIPAFLLAVIGILVVALPAWASVKSTHFHLEESNERIITKTKMDAMDWIKKHTEPDAVFLANPEEPWPIPLFTGRSILRAEGYWASPQDDTLDKMRAAFSGDKEAQTAVLADADYLFIPQSNRPLWEGQKIIRVYKNHNFFVYKIKGK